MTTSRAPRGRLKRTTIKDVAKLAQVSVASVSRALNGLDDVAESTRERVLSAARELKFTPNLTARALIRQRTGAIGLILPDLHGEFYSELIRGVDVAARARDLHLLVSSSHGDARETARAMRALHGMVDGVLVMASHIEESVDDALDADLPAVLLNAGLEHPLFPSFRVDNFAGAFAVTRHLVETGRRRIAHIAGPDLNHEALERRRGYEAALPPDMSANVAAGRFTDDTGYAATFELFRDKPAPDAIFAGNDAMAVGALIALRELGKRTPHDVALAGFDDVPLARLIDPGLTTLRVEIAEVGSRAADKLADWIERGSIPATSEIVKPQLMVRASTGRAHPCND